MRRRNIIISRKKEREEIEVYSPTSNYRIPGSSSGPSKKHKQANAGFQGRSRDQHDAGFQGESHDQHHIGFRGGSRDQHRVDFQGRSRDQHHADFQGKSRDQHHVGFQGGLMINTPLMRLLEETRLTSRYNTSASCTQKAPTQSLSATHSVKPSEHRCWT